MSVWPTTCLRPLVAGWALMSVVSAHAAVGFTVNFDDPTGSYTAYYADIRNNVLAAGNDWLSRFQLGTVNTTLDVSIGFSNTIATANGASFTSSFVGTLGSFNVFEQGAAAKLKTGIDVNGPSPDIRFNLGTAGYLQNEMWFDPNPTLQTAVVPDNRTDARSIFLHEFGHAFAFNGWRSGIDGSLPGNYMSTFDLLTSTEVIPGIGFSSYFTGAAATALYGDDVPLTFNNPFHVANYAPRDGVGLTGDLMNGIVFYRGTRYQISALDLAIMQDVGLPFAIPVPEPSSALLMVAGAAALLVLRRRKSLIAS